ncbi:MAG: RecX family transcriptional regulator [Clostridia bacterium]|nr:RecX family transcriptional regulator [Clostridia bacterium]
MNETYRVKEVAPLAGQLSVTVESADGMTEKYSVAKEFFKPLGIEDGDLIGDEELFALSHASDLTAAVSKALDALSYSSMSRRALTDKLRFKYKFSRSLAEDAADYVVKRHYIDETSQAKRIADVAVRTKFWGRRRISAYLVSKGYPANVADDAARSVKGEEYRAALLKVIDKKAGGSLDEAEYKKLVSALIRLGHDPSDVRTALSEKENDND